VVRLKIKKKGEVNFMAVRQIYLERVNLSMDELQEAIQVALKANGIDNCIDSVMETVYEQQLRVGKKNYVS
jgi:restriction endonuclease Mrr